MEMIYTTDEPRYYLILFREVILMNLMSFLIVSQASEQLGCSKVTVRQLIQRGTLAAQETPYGWLIEPESVQRLNETRKGQWHPGSRGRGKKGPVKSREV
jgi:excisionase family DNA binding protein